MTVFLFRHGETDWNAERRIQGQTDIPLNDTGRAQALLLGETLRDLHVDIIVTSDLMRAFETARLACGDLDLSILPTPALREAFFGEAEGLLREEIIAQFGDDAWERWISIDHADLEHRFPLGETKREQLQRAQGFLEDFLTASDYSRIAVSTHGGPIRRIIHHGVNGAPEDPQSVPNCAIFELNFDRLTRQWHYIRRVR